jgi:catechol 2,3-dioxygenase-like lactoylglutathione lyase family enzyme
MLTDASLDAARLTGLAPQFLVDDIETAIAYYRDKLGFALDFKYESFYAGVSRDGLVVHLKQASKLAGERAHRRQNEHLDAYYFRDGCESLTSGTRDPQRPYHQTDRGAALGLRGLLRRGRGWIRLVL